jgi:phosphosulfolactate synthase
MTKRPFEFVSLPAERSMSKPRATGRTMMIDWGWDIERLGPLLRLIGAYVDLAKIPIGMARLYDEDYLGEKFALYRRHDIQTWIGGGFVEHMFGLEGIGSLPRLFDEVKRVGFDILEISDNYIPLTREQRQYQIQLGREHGLIVYGEVGSKHEKSDAKTLIAQAQDCLEAGAEMVVLEGAEFFEWGEIKRDMLNELKTGMDTTRAIFELFGPWVSGAEPSKVQDLIKFLIKEFGPDVNIANVMPDDVLHTEAMRVGLGVVQPTEIAAHSAA